jgi:short chain dehydrogenase
MAYCAGCQIEILGRSPKRACARDGLESSYDEPDSAIDANFSFVEKPSSRQNSCNDKQGWDETMLLKDKTAVISGAASPRGIGFATARLFAEHGARVAILDLDEADARRAAQELGDGHVGIACDVTKRDSCGGAARQVIDAFGDIDILVNNAGITQPVKTIDITEIDWRRIVDVNMTGVLYLSQAFIPHMRERKKGSIACMSSVSAQRGGGIFGGPHYRQVCWGWQKRWPANWGRMASA